MTRAGDDDLLTRLVSEQMPEILRFATRLTGRADSAEEVVQEALYRAARSVGTFGGRCEFRTWFYRILISAFRDYLAAAGRRTGPELPTDDLVDPKAMAPSAMAETGELSRMVAQRVSALPPRQREVLVLIAYEGIRPKDAAALLGISEASVYVNLHHARVRLRAELASYFDVPPVRGRPGLRNEAVPEAEVGGER